MSANEMAAKTAARRPPAKPARLIAVIGLTFALGYLIVLGGAYLKGDFLVDPQGQPIANDFVNVIAAGHMARDGAPASAYDWLKHKDAETAAVGHDFAGYYGWHYPPTFLFVAAALATLPYLVAALVWLGVTGGVYVMAIAGILGRRIGPWLALGFPAALWNVTAGQNGFLTAALIGGTLGFLERRPALAGLCLGLLTYKPQFGLLFPLALIADRRWLTLAVAAAVAVTVAGLSWLAFGGASWLAFLHWLPITSQRVLGEGQGDFSRLQSLYAMVRSHGGDATLAWTVQTAASLAAAIGVVWLWRRCLPYELKAAVLAAATLIATPYVFMYDLVVLAVAVAFLLRFALERGFSESEIGGLAGAGALILIYPLVKTQVGLAAVLIVLLLVAKRVIASVRRDDVYVALQ